MMSSTQGLPTAEPEEVGFSSERFARIRPALQRYIDRNEYPGIVTMIARHGKVAYFETQGMKDIEAGEPVAKDTIFRMASATKLVTTAAVLMLYEEGLLTLDDPISKFLPAFKNPVVAVFDQPSGEKPYFHGAHSSGSGIPPVVYTEPARREITIRDCLTHTAGFATQRRAPIGLLGPLMAFARGGTPVVPREGGTLEPLAAPVIAMSESLKRLAGIPLTFHPGTAWDYGPGLDVVGVIIEVVSGQTLEEFFKERILEPLGMYDTAYYLPEEKILSRMATLYVRVGGPGEKMTLVPAERPADSHQVKGPKIRFSGSGGLLSTALDWARFAQMLLNGGELDGVRLLGRKAVELMMTNHTGDLRIYLMGEGYGYGLGGYVRTSLTGVPEIGSVGAYGWCGGYVTFVWLDPKEDMFGLMFTQAHGTAYPGLLGLWKECQMQAYQALV